jgi:hypothetical protein
MDEWELEVSQVTGPVVFSSGFNSAVPFFLNEFLHVLLLSSILLLFLNSNITRMPFIHYQVSHPFYLFKPLRDLDFFVSLPSQSHVSLSSTFL